MNPTFSKTVLPALYSAGIVKELVRNVQENLREYNHSENDNETIKIVLRILPVSGSEGGIAVSRLILMLYVDGHDDAKLIIPEISTSTETHAKKKSKQASH